MASKAHAKGTRSPHWVNPDTLSSTQKNYSSLWLRSLSLKMWLNRNQLTGVKLPKKSLNSKFKLKNGVKQGPISIKTNFRNIVVSSWHQSSLKSLRSRIPKNFRGS